MKKKKCFETFKLTAEFEIEGIDWNDAEEEMVEAVKMKRQGGGTGVVNWEFIKMEKQAKEVG